MSKFSVSPDKIREIIEHRMNAAEKSGVKENSDESVADIACTLLSTEEPEKTHKGWALSYTYRVEIITEFTYYPENPADTYEKTAVLEFDESGKLIT